MSIVLWYQFSSAGSTTTKQTSRGTKLTSSGTKLKEKRRTDRLTPAGRYEGMVDTIVQLFRVYASVVITLVYAIWVNQKPGAPGG